MQEQIVNKIKDYIGSPEGLGKAKKSPPALGTSLVRRVLWRDGNLTEKKNNSRRIYWKWSKQRGI